MMIVNVASYAAKVISVIVSLSLFWLVIWQSIRQRDNQCHSNKILSPILENNYG